MILFKSVLLVFAFANAWVKGSPAPKLEIEHDVVKEKYNYGTAKQYLKDDWKNNPIHEKHINRHSWILIPEKYEHHLHRFKRTVPYEEEEDNDKTTFPYKDLGNNNNIKRKNKKKRNHTSNTINNNNSTRKATTKKKKYHRLAHTVHVQSDIRYR